MVAFAHEIFFTEKAHRLFFNKFFLDKGDEKKAKEWHLMLIPISPTRAENIQNGSIQELTREECVPQILQIQIKRDLPRINQELKKDNREVEMEWPNSSERNDLERQYHRMKRKRIQNLSKSELKEKISKMKQKQSQKN